MNLMKALVLAGAVIASSASGLSAAERERMIVTILTVKNTTGVTVTYLVEDAYNRYEATIQPGGSAKFTLAHEGTVHWGAAYVGSDGETHQVGPNALAIGNVKEFTHTLYAK